MFVVDVLLYKHARLSLRLNKTTIAKIYRGSNFTKSPAIQISRTVLLKLKRGDHVKIVSDFNNIYISSNKYSGFTGTFLY